MIRYTLLFIITKLIEQWCNLCAVFLYTLLIHLVIEYYYVDKLPMVLYNNNHSFVIFFGIKFVLFLIILSSMKRETM